MTMTSTGMTLKKSCQILRIKMTHCMVQVQESMVNPLQVTQEIYQLQDNDTDPNPNVQAETIASTSQPPSSSTSNSASSLTVPSSSVSQPPSTTISLPSATPTSNSYRAPIPFTQHVGPTQLLDGDSTPLDLILGRVTSPRTES